MTKLKVLVADPIAQRGIDELSNGGQFDVTVKLGLKPEELLTIIGEFQGLVLRSETKATAKVIKAATNLKVIGRAGWACKMWMWRENVCLPSGAPFGAHPWLWTQSGGSRSRTRSTTG